MKQESEQQKTNDRINSELLEVEKALNMFYGNIGKLGITLKKFVSVPIMVSRDVQTILENEGYMVEKDISNPNETKLFFNKDNYKKYNSDKHKHDIDIPYRGNSSRTIIKSVNGIDMDTLKESKSTNWISEEDRKKLSKLFSQERGYKPLSEDENNDKMSMLKDGNKNTKELEDRYYKLKNKIDNILENVSKQESENIKNIGKELILLNSKLEAKQQRLEMLEIVIKSMRDSIRFGIKPNYEKLNELLDERSELGNEISKIKSEIHSIKFSEKLNQELERMYPSIKIFRF